MTENQIESIKSFSSFSSFSNFSLKDYILLSCAAIITLSILIFVILSCSNNIHFTSPMNLTCSNVSISCPDIPACPAAPNCNCPAAINNITISQNITISHLNISSANLTVVWSAP